jgi:tricarballylate dehydrogenase
VGLRPEKTNWATRLDAPPFQAYAATVGITFTFGGIRINADAAVVDYLERPIPGLFATGEMTGGFFYLNYPGGAGLMRGAVFGRIAGTNAARCARG